MNTIQSFLRNSERIVSFVTGLLVIFVIGTLVYSIVQKREVTKKKEEATVTTTPVVHTVADGESLWAISTNYFKTGYNWVDIALANNLSNPDYITVGQKLVIPDVEPKFVEEGQISATDTVKPKHTTVTVTIGDTLWDIAVSEFGSGYRWTDIARMNAIPNPDIIYPGTVLRME